MKTNPQNRCWNCEEKLDGASDASGEGKHPKEGDVTICAYCSAISIFNTDLSLRLPTQSELEVILEHLSNEEAPFRDRSH